MKLNKINIWALIAINLCISFLMVVSLVHSNRRNTRKSIDYNKNEILQTTINNANFSTLFFDLQRITLFDRREYANKTNITEYDIFSNFLEDNNSDTNMLYQIVRVDNYTGFSSTGMGNVKAVDYSTYNHVAIQSACDSVKNDTYDESIINITGVFTNPVNGMQSNAVYINITLDCEGEDVEYLLLATTKIAYFADIVAPTIHYGHADATVIDGSGNYVIPNKAFKGINFYEYIRSYNDIGYDNKEKLNAKVLEKGEGNFIYKNYLGNKCVYSYKQIDGTNNLFYITCINYDEVEKNNTDYTSTLILCFFVVLLVASNGFMLRIFIKKLRNSLSETQLAKEEALLATKSRDDFLSNMSHEIRTPLNAIIGLNELAKDNLTNKTELRNYLNDIELSSKHLLSLMNDVLDMNMVGQNNFVLHEEVFSFKEMIEVISSIYSANAKEKKLDFQINCNGNDNYYLFGDELRLRQVLVNLISNAIKYNREGGFVYLIITTSQKEDKLNINFVVEDSGIGIAPEKQAIIFNAFERDYNSETKNILGSGLGLAISSKLVGIMGGKLEVQSELDKGSKFFFNIELPIREKPPADEYDISCLKGKKILVADDKMINQIIAKKNIEANNMECIVANDGKECVEIFDNSQINEIFAILMDIRMPVMDGLEAARMIRNLERADAKEVIIVAVSANAYSSDVNVSLEAGMNMHLCKPLSFAKLFTNLKEIRDENEEKKNTSS